MKRKEAAEKPDIAHAHFNIKRTKLLSNIGPWMTERKQNNAPSFFQKLAAVPVHVPGNMIRYYAYWKIFYILAGAGH